MPGVDNFPGRLQTVKPQTTLQAFCKGDDSFCLAVSNQAADFWRETEKIQLTNCHAHLQALISTRSFGLDQLVSLRAKTLPSLRGNDPARHPY